MFLTEAARTHTITTVQVSRESAALHYLSAVFVSTQPHINSVDD